MLKTAVCCVLLATAAPALAQTTAIPHIGIDAVADQRTPWLGESIIRFNGRQIEVAGAVRGAVFGGHFGIALPDGAPPLPAVAFAPVKLPDGHIVYTPASAQAVSIQVSQPRESVVPSDLLQIILVDDTKERPVFGALQKGDVAVTIPFTYARPIRVSDDITAPGLFARDVIAVKGEMGFEAGRYSGASYYGLAAMGRAGVDRVVCLFDPRSAKPYDLPRCFAEQTVKGATSLLPAYALSNVPNHLDIPVQAGAGHLAFDPADAPVDHDFQLQLVVGAWSAKGLELEYRSDGRLVSKTTHAPDAEGNVKLKLGDGWLLLRPDPADRTRTVSSRLPFTAVEARQPNYIAINYDHRTVKPDALAATLAGPMAPLAPPAAPHPAAAGAPLIVDGIAYTPAS